jgi:hypothetical protein
MGWVGKIEFTSQVGERLGERLNAARSCIGQALFHTFDGLLALSLEQSQGFSHKVLFVRKAAERYFLTDERLEVRGISMGIR